MSGTISFSTPMVHATDSGTSRYALSGTLVTPQGDAIATDGRIMAITRVNVAGLDRPVIVPSELGPKTQADTGRATYAVNCTKVTKRVHGKPETTADCVVGSFPRAFEVLPKSVGDCTVLALNAELLLKLAKAINSTGNDPIVKLLIPPAEKGVIKGAICTIGGEGIGVIMPVYVEKLDAAEVAVSFENRRDSLAYLNDTIAAHNLAANKPAAA